RADGDRAPDAPGRSGNCRHFGLHQHSHPWTTADQMKAPPSIENKNVLFVLLSAATRHKTSTCRCRFGKSSPPLLAKNLCRAASKQTMALQFFAENKSQCRCGKELRPAICPGRAPSHHDSTARLPESCSSSCRIFPAAHRSSLARKNLPDPTIRPHLNSVPLVRATYTRLHAASRNHRSCCD